MPYLHHEEEGVITTTTFLEKVKYMLEEVNTDLTILEVCKDFKRGNLCKAGFLLWLLTKREKLQPCVQYKMVSIVEHHIKNFIFT